MIFHLLDVALWNAFYIYQKHKNNKNSQLEFREQVINSLLGLYASCSGAPTGSILSTQKFKQHFQEKIPSAVGKPNPKEKL